MATQSKTDKVNSLLLPLCALSFFIICYYSAFYKMSQRWSNGDNNYCYLVIPLFAYLLWDRRHKEAKGLGLKAQNASLKKDGRGRMDEGRERNDRRLEDQKLGRLEGEG